MTSYGAGFEFLTGARAASRLALTAKYACERSAFQYCCPTWGSNRPLGGEGSDVTTEPRKGSVNWRSESSLGTPSADEPVGFSTATPKAPVNLLIILS